ncbi:MAG: hypothetical protein ACRYFK_02585 [Janthinobacterium lividum]
MAAYATGQWSIGQVASRFAVSVSFVDKLLKRLAACVATQPDATLAELRQQLVAAGSPAVGQTVLWQTLQQLDLRRKKRVCMPPSATRSE